MPNAIVYFACQVGDAHGVTMPLFRKYVAHKAAWRSAVSKWLDLSLEDAKKMLLKACYGFSLPSRSGGSSKVCPLLDGLAREGLELREAVCTAYPGLVEAMCLARRPRPETSAVAMLLLDLENRWMRGFVELLPRHNFRLVASIFDAVVALPTAQADEEGLLQEFQDLCGLAMQVRPACPPAFCDGVREALARLTAAGKGVLDAQTETVAGEAMCIPTAVINLFPCAAASVKMSRGSKGRSRIRNSWTSVRILSSKRCQWQMRLQPKTTPASCCTKVACSNPNAGMPLASSWMVRRLSFPARSRKRPGVGTEQPSRQKCSACLA